MNEERKISTRSMQLVGTNNPSKFLGHYYLLRKVFYFNTAYFKGKEQNQRC